MVDTDHQGKGGEPSITRPSCSTPGRFERKHPNTALLCVEAYTVILFSTCLNKHNFICSVPTVSAIHGIGQSRYS